MIDNNNSGEIIISIPSDEKEDVKTRIVMYSAEQYGNMFGLIKIDIRFRGYFCYIESYHEPHGTVRMCS
ncbi:hypothetical protein ACKUB1_15430 [Methanospirillum stamsii]|uniref:Uncharacterized protein n=1 Tax=Methanospirillum stamsii TaxID=1277351 RepID=A0A2V2MVW6_9EURY|nr:hypothetical protein [Methanospirillum stamsii]PWR69526.1 hypothetical protein DLD82_17810 [Methanospirillum stamsii]